MRTSEMGISSAGQLGAVLLGVGLVAGCGVGASYVPTAGSPYAMAPKSPQDVEVFPSTRPDRPYLEVGMIEVQQQPMNGAGPNALVDEMRRVAAQKGCDGVLISGANDAVIGGGSSQNGTGTWGARTLKGYRGTCIMFKDGKPSEPPRGAGGFTFDTDVATNEAACSRATLTWGAGEASRFTCSGVLADVGMSATTALRFCEGHLCTIELHAMPKGTGATQWADEFRTLRKALERKYGRPAGEEGADPPDCTADPEPCSTPGRTAHIVRWKWTSGERIELAMVVSQTPLGENLRRSAEFVLSYGKENPGQQPASTPRYDGL